MVNFAIINTSLLTMKGQGLGIIENGTLAIDNDVIVYAGPSDGFDASGTSTIIGVMIESGVQRE